MICVTLEETDTRLLTGNATYHDNGTINLLRGVYIKLISRE